jgi:hypothetical protein
MVGSTNTRPDVLVIHSAIAMLVLASHRPWWIVGTLVLLPAAIPAVGRRINDGVVLIAVPVAWGLAGSAGRTINGTSNVLALLTNADDLDFEAYARSIARLGPRGDLMTSGTPLKYHFLSFGWIGGVTDAAGAAPYAVLTVLGPLMISMVCTGLAMHWFRASHGSRSVVLLPSLLLLAGARPGEATYFLDFSSWSLVVAHSWLLALIVTLDSRPWSLGSLTNQSILLMAIMLAKVQTGIVVAIGMLLVHHRFLRAPFREAAREYLRVVLTVAPALLSFLLLLSPLASGADDYASRISFGINGEFLGARIPLLLALFIVFVRFPVWVRPPMMATPTGRLLASVYAAGLIVALGHQAHTSYSNLFLLALLAPFAALSTWNALGSIHGARRSIFGAVAISLVVGAAITVSHSWLNFRHVSPSRLDALLLLEALLSLVAVLSVSWLIAHRSRPLGMITHRPGAIAMACLAAMAIGSFLGHVPRGYVARLAEGRSLITSSSPYLATTASDLAPIAVWLGRHACHDATIAVATATDGETGLQPADGRILVAQTGLQMYVTPGAVSTGERQRRNDLIASLARVSEPWLLPEWSEIVREGVSLVVLDRSLIPNAPPHALFESDRFVVAELRRSPPNAECVGAPQPVAVG